MTGEDLGISRNTAKVVLCIACGNAFHGRCERELKCINCGGKHKATERTCAVYEDNRVLKRIIAFENVNIQEAREILRGRQNSGAKEHRNGRNNLDKHKESSVVVAVTEKDNGYDRENDNFRLGDADRVVDRGIPNANRRLYVEAIRNNKNTAVIRNNRNIRDISSVKDIILVIETLQIESVVDPLFISA